MRFSLKAMPVLSGRWPQIKQLRQLSGRRHVALDPKRTALHSVVY
jgi:hypothetical protein